MVNNSIYKIVVERGGGFTKLNTVAVVVVTTFTALPPSSLPSFFCFLYYLIYILL